LVSVPLVVLSSESKEDLPIFSSVLLVLMLDGIVSILQYFFLLALPPDYWGNSVEPKRAIGLFVHPNAHSLFITPLLSWVMPFLYEQVRLLWEKGKRFLPIFYLFCFAIGVVGLFLSLSRGGWLGFAFACVVFVFAVSSKVLKKIFLSLALFSVIFVLSVPVLRYRVALPFYGEKSAVARLSLWNTAGKMIKDSPLFGKGVNGFNLNWDKYNSDPGLLHYNFPHNIFLNFWVDFGLPGMIAFISLCCVLIWKGVVNKKQNRFALPLVLALIAILAHGLIDIPYLKNDLALMFWLFVSFYLGWMVRNDHLNG
jgi:O-antigen ligase